MPQQNIKQIRGASQGSILFLGTNSVVGEDFDNLNWDQSNSVLYINGNLKINDGNQQAGYVLTSDGDGNTTWQSIVGVTGATGSTGPVPANSLVYFTGGNPTIAGSGDVGSNGTLATTTQISINETSYLGYTGLTGSLGNADTWLSNIQVGDIIQLTSINNSNLFGIYTVVTANDGGDYRYFDVTLLSSSSGSFATNEYVSVSYLKRGPSGSGSTSSISGTGSNGLGTYWLDSNTLSYMNLGISQSTGDIRYIDFDTTVQNGNTLGRLSWNSNEGTLDLGLDSDVVLQIGQEMHYRVKNQTGATISNGRLVSSVGTLGASGRILASYSIADGSVPARFIMGIATEDILNGDDGYVTNFGLVRGIDATGTPYGETWNDGDVLWANPNIPGGLTNIEPQPGGSFNIKVVVAFVVHNISNGSIFVRVSNGNKLHELHDVEYDSNLLTDDSILKWTTAGQYWTQSINSFDNLSNVNIISATSNDTLRYDGSNWVNTSFVKSDSSGTFSISGTFRYIDGNQQNGYVLKSDSNGFAIWSPENTSGGLTSLNGLTQSIQYFTASNDSNVNLNINSSGSTHSYNLSWNGLLPISRGGLSNSTFTASQILIMNSTTSSVVSSGYTINDIGTSSNDIWSAQRTIQYIESVTLSGGRANSNATNIYLRSGDGLPYNTTPFVLPFDGIIKSISISTSANDTWIGEVRNNGVLISGASLSSVAQSFTYSSYNINVNAGSQLQLYVNGSNIPNPRMVVTIIKR